MRPPKISVIVPTHNRQGELETTLVALRCQSVSPTKFEVIVVDDGSSPPVAPAGSSAILPCTLVRLGGSGRSVARNTGAGSARGELLVFIDDDITVSPEFLAAHLRAHQEWPDALCTGEIVLPDQALAHPFGRFRQALERHGVPRQRGLASCSNLCAAGNMSISRSAFLALGGFDTTMSSAEDQDLALRHAVAGGRIAYVPEARAIHRDRALDVRAFCVRHQWGMEQLMPFVRRYPELADNIERERVNGFVNWGREPIKLSMKKVLKCVLSSPPLKHGLFVVADALECALPHSSLLDRLYRILLGIHIQSGYRRGLKCSDLECGGLPPLSGRETSRKREQAPALQREFP